MASIRKQDSAILIVLPTLSAVDAITTWLLINGGFGSEKNPIAIGIINSFGLTGACIFRFLAGCVIAGIGVWGARHLKPITILLWLAVISIYWGAVCYNNIYWLGRANA